VSDDRLQVIGSGFTDASAVYFIDWRQGLVPAPCVALSDTLLEVQIPIVRTHPGDNHESGMLVVTPAGATITVPPDFQEVRSAIVPGAIDFYLVKSGGSLAAGGSGDVEGYLEQGASAQTGGGGGHTYFLESGAMLNLEAGGGGHLAVQAVGARIIGTPGTLLSVPSLKPSFPPAILRILPTPQFMNSEGGRAIVGRSFSFQLWVDSWEPEIVYEATGLPPGLVVNSSSGLISGMPQAAGVFPVQLTARNLNGAGTTTLTFTVIEPQMPVISTKGAFRAEQGVPFSLQIVATHSPTQYVATGLPLGLSINPVTGLISGSATATGAFRVAVQASNAIGAGTKDIAILIATKQPQITSLPETATAGERILVRGEGFTGTSEVVFTDYRGDWITADFEVLSDEQLRVTVPSLVFHPRFGGATRIHVITPAGATVTVPPDFTRVAGEAAAAFFDFHVVESGGVLTGGGSAAAYVASGGSAMLSGGGNSYFVEAGGLLTLSSGAQVVSALGAEITGVPSRSVQVPIVSPSFVSHLVNVLPVPSITSSRSALGSLGLPFIYTTSATNQPNSFSAQGLPPGLSVNAENGIISGRPTGGEGVFEVTLTAINEHGSGTVIILVSVRDDYRTWKSAKFASLAGGAASPMAADAADPDRDGVSNLVEFATGLDPIRNEPGIWPLQPIMNGGSPQFRYRRLKGPGTGTTEAGYTLGTVTYILLASGDLSTWQTGADRFTQVGSPVDNGDGTETVTVTLDEEGNQFVKLQITHAANTPVGEE
jgi:PKD repeat protein